MPKINVEKIQSLTGHKDCLYSLSGGKEKNIIFTAGGDGLVVEWDLKNPGLGKMIAQVPHSIFALNYIQSTNQLIIGHNFEGVHLLNLESKVEEKSAKITSAYIFDLLADGDFIFCACGDGQLIILNAKDLSVIKRLQISQKSLRSLAIDPKGVELAIGCSDNNIYIVALESLKIKHSLTDHTNSVFTLCYHPKRNYLMSAGRDAHIKVWHNESYEIVEDIVAHMYAINHIQFSPDKKYFASCSMDKSIKIWDAETFKLLKVIDKARHAGHGTSVNKLLWTSYEDCLISVSDDRSASIWNIQIDN